MVVEALRILERRTSELTQVANDGVYQPVADGASQPVETNVDGCIGLIIGNHHIVQGRSLVHTPKQKKTVVCEFLDALAGYRFKNVDENAELSIVRVLVGDCNLERQVAEDCTQGRNIPCSGLPMQCSKKAHLRAGE